MYLRPHNVYRKRLKPYGTRIKNAQGKRRNMYSLEKDIDFIEYMQNWQHALSLEDKVCHAKNVLEHIAKHFAPHEVAVAWTAGKDSTVLLALWREVLAAVHPEAQVLALNLDTGHKFPEIIAFRDELATLWNMNMHIARPDWAALCRGRALTSPDAYPVAQNHVQCCLDLKITPLEKAIHDLGIKVLLTGIRADEHEERAKRGMVEHCHQEQAKAHHTRIHAILAFTEMDIWAYSMSHNIPYCSLYTQGYRSLGCVPCTHIATCGDMGQGGQTEGNQAEGAQAHGSGERAGRNQAKEAAMQNLHELGYF